MREKNRNNLISLKKKKKKNHYVNGWYNFFLFSYSGEQLNIKYEYHIKIYWDCVKVSLVCWFNIKMSSYQYRKSHCGDKMVVRSFYLHNRISYTGKMTSLYWIAAQVVMLHSSLYTYNHFHIKYIPRNSWFVFHSVLVRFDCSFYPYSWGLIHMIASVPKMQPSRIGGD